MVTRSVPQVLRQVQRCALLFFAFTCILAAVDAQSPVSAVEYYIDQDPGIGRAQPVTISSAVTVSNASFSIATSSLSTGIHMVGVRARTSAGAWGMTHFWFIFKPYQVTTPATLANISRVEYYVDADPGAGKGTPVIVSQGTDLSNLSFSINPSALSKGTHIIGARALATDGNWSQTNYWLFYNVSENLSPVTAKAIDYVEYFVNKDPGFGKAIAVSITPATDLANQALTLATDSSKPGANIVGIRAKRQDGTWSLTNYWLFVKPFTTSPAPGAAGNIVAIEYFLDYDPGAGKGTPIAITPGTDFSNLSVNTDITGIIPGDHYVTIRAKDNSGNWSLLNNIKFNIAGSAPVLVTNFTPASTVCAGSSVAIGYSVPGVTFNPQNKFLVQLSDASGNFANPVLIGTKDTVAASGTINATIPVGIASGSQYRVRVVATSQNIVGSPNTGNLVIAAMPTEPTITPGSDTTICSGSLQLTAGNVSGTVQWLLNGAPVTNATGLSYNATASGAYSLKITSSGCSINSAKKINLTLGVTGAAPVISASGTLSLCTGGSVVLTSSSINGNQWLKDGLTLSGSTARSLTVTTAGIYSVRVTAGTTCAVTSASVTVTITTAPNKPTISISGNRLPSICPGSNDTLLSSASSGNQWYLDSTAISGATGTSYVASKPGSYRVKVSNGACSDSSTVTQISLLPVPGTPQIGSNNQKKIICDKGTLTLLALNRTGSVQWLLNGSAVAGATDTLLTISAGGVYGLRVTNSSGCSAVAATFTVTASLPSQKPIIRNGAAVKFCKGDSVLLTTNARTGIQWYQNAALLAGSTDSSLNVKTAGEFRVAVTDSNGCRSEFSDSLVVTVSPVPVTPVLTARGSTSFCVGDTVVLAVVAAPVIRWYRDNQLITFANSDVLNTSASGLYRVQSTNSDGCSALSNGVTLTANPLPSIPVITAPATLSFCAGSSITLSSSASSDNQWLRNGGAIAGATGVTYSASLSGSYTVVVRNTAGCTNVARPLQITAVDAPVTPVITANGPLSFCDTGKVGLTSSASAGNQWYLDNAIIPTATAASFTATRSGSYTVKVSNSNNCSAVSAGVAVTSLTIPAKPVITQNGSALVSSSSVGNEWFADLTPISGATLQTYQPTTNGYYRVQVNNAGCRSVISDPFYRLVTAIANITGTGSATYTILPNPVTDKLIISARSSADKITAQVIDVNGRVWINQSFSGRATIQTGGLAAGSYILLLTDSRTKKQESKLIIKH